MPRTKIFLGNYEETIKRYKADLIFTSPPYNIGSESPAKTGKRNKKKGTYDPKSYRGIREYADNLPEDEYQKQQVDFLRWCARHLKPGGTVVYNHKPRRKNLKMIHPMSWISKVKQLTLMEEIIWDRGSTHNHSNRLMHPITERLYVLRLTNDKYTFLNTSELDYRSDVWRLGRAPVNGHNAPFPEELARNVIKAWTKPGDTVMDPYSGSGTTLFAALKEDRNFVGSEILPEYHEKITEKLAKIP